MRDPLKEIVFDSPAEMKCFTDFFSSESEVCCNDPTFRVGIAFTATMRGIIIGQDAVELDM